MKFIYLKNYKGVAVLEAALVLPIVIYLIFFIIEAMKVNNALSAIESITSEASFYFISNRNTTAFQEIIAKYRPVYIPRNNIQWYFAVYNNLNTMCQNEPCGGEEIYWPSATGISTGSYLDMNKNNKFDARANALSLSDATRPEGTEGSIGALSGKAFVLTFVCKYEFSNGLVQKLFSGGTNVQQSGTKMFLLTGRGVGICN